MDQLPRLGKRELICLLLFTCNYVVSVWRGFLFLWVLGMATLFYCGTPLAFHLIIKGKNHIRVGDLDYFIHFLYPLPRRLHIIFTLIGQADKEVNSAYESRTYKGRLFQKRTNHGCIQMQILISHVLTRSLKGIRSQRLSFISRERRWRA